MYRNRNVQLTLNNPTHVNYGLKVVSHFGTRGYGTEPNYVENIVNLDNTIQNKIS